MGADESGSVFARLGRRGVFGRMHEQLDELLAARDQMELLLQLIAERARELTGAEQAIVLVPTDAEQPPAEVDTLTVSTAVGLHAAEVIGQEVPVAGSTTGEVFRSATPVITDIGQRPAIVMPLRAADMVVGVIAVTRTADQPPFDNDHLDMLGDFADHVAMALPLAEAREQARELTVLADRERIARDLHDHVIQRLFVTGMDVQGTIACARSPQVIERLTRTVDDLQSTIDDIRTAIFDLQSPAATEKNFRQRIQAVAD